MNGVRFVETAIAFPSGLNATPLEVLGGNVDGFAYLVPKPETDQVYAAMNGILLCETAIAFPSGLKATL